jgi:hypothetical protein
MPAPSTSEGDADQYFAPHEIPLYSYQPAAAENQEFFPEEKNEQKLFAILSLLVLAS